MLLITLLTRRHLFLHPLTVLAAIFVLQGNVKLRHKNWAAQAAQHVQLPSGTFTIQNGSPEYIPERRAIYIPYAGTNGWTYHAEHGEFVHELGHAYDYTRMRPWQRTRFKQLAVTRCSWWSTSCKLAPGEMFAEMYASCALGITQAEYQAQGYMTYGWRPPPGNDPLICAMIR